GEYGQRRLAAYHRRQRSDAGAGLRHYCRGHAAAFGGESGRFRPGRTIFRVTVGAGGNRAKPGCRRRTGQRLINAHDSALRNVATAGSRVSPAFPRITRSATSSSGVSSSLIMTSTAPASLARNGIPAAGYTCKDEPIDSIVSHRAAKSAAASITSGASAWPNEIVADLIKPPQCGHRGSDSPAST